MMQGTGSNSFDLLYIKKEKKGLDMGVLGDLIWMKDIL